MKLAMLSRYDSEVALNAALLVPRDPRIEDPADSAFLDKNCDCDGERPCAEPASAAPPACTADTATWKAEWLRVAEEAGRQRRTDADVAALSASEINALSNAYFDALTRCMADLRVVLLAGCDIGDFEAISVLMRAVEALHEQRRLTLCHGWDVLTRENRLNWCRCEQAWNGMRSEFVF